jgi:hypothetical protein
VVAVSAMPKSMVLHASSDPRVGNFSHTMPYACRLSETMACMSGPSEPQSEIRGRRATFFALASAVVLRSPIMVKLVHTMVELTMPAKKRKTAQPARLVTKPPLKQQISMLHSPSNVTRRLPMRSARKPQKSPDVPPKAYAQSRMLRR